MVREVRQKKRLTAIEKKRVMEAVQDCEPEATKVRHEKLSEILTNSGLLKVIQEGSQKNEEQTTVQLLKRIKGMVNMELRRTLAKVC